MDSWYQEGDTLMKNCPMCQKESGYNKSLLYYAMDEAIEAIEQLEQLESKLVFAVEYKPTTMNQMF